MELRTNEFRIATGWRIFVYITFSLILLLFISFAIIPVLKVDSISPPLYVFLLIISLMVIVGFRYVVLLTARTKFVIEEDSILFFGFRTVRKFSFDEIKGFEKDQNKISIQLHDNRLKPLEISKYFERYNEIEIWCEKNLTNLIHKLIADEYNAIIDNDDYGKDTFAREKSFSRAKKIAVLINLSSMILAGWLIFYPTPYELSMWSNIVASVLFVVIIHSQKGLIRYFKHKDGAHPDAAMAVFLTPLAICIRSLFDNDMLNYSNVWWPLIGLNAFLVIILYLLGSKPLQNSTTKFEMIIAMMISTASFSLGFILFTNSYYDHSTSKSFQAVIIEKRISHGKHTSYYLQLSNWGKEDDHAERDVSEDFYHSIEVGDSIQVSVHRGKWDIPWISLSDKVVSQR